MRISADFVFISENQRSSASPNFFTLNLVELHFVILAE